MSQFLTVKEAARLTGKSPSSIRRVIYPIIRDDKHADRKHVKPNVEDALKLRMKGENFAWRLSEELLRREVPRSFLSVSSDSSFQLRRIRVSPQEATIGQWHCVDRKCARRDARTQ